MRLIVKLLTGRFDLSPTEDVRTSTYGHDNRTAKFADSFDNVTGLVRRKDAGGDQQATNTDCQSFPELARFPSVFHVITSLLLYKLTNQVSKQLNLST